MSDLITAALHRVSADNAARTISGTVLVYNVTASASSGRVQFHPGSLILPEDLSRVKLCIDHDHHSAVGYAIAAEDNAESLRMTFHVPATPAGDEALASAAAGIRDGLSVGAYPEKDGFQYINGEDCTHITAANLREVSLVAVPAFDAARVSDVAAAAPQDPNRKDTEMTDSTAIVQASTEPTSTLATEPTSVPLAAPAILTPKTGATSVRAAAALAAEMLTSGAPASAVSAALSDVIPADDAGKGFLGRDSWLGELWAARRVARPLIDAMTRRPLGRTIKVRGWQWETRPEVGSYSGNKTDIPSNKVKTKAIEADVKRIAGGWDVDRIYADLGDPDMIAALWEGAVEDYAIKTEADVASTLLAAATVVETAQTSLPGALVALGAKAASHGSAIHYVGFGVDVWTQFAALTRDQVPWWMTGQDGLNLSTTEGSVNGLSVFVDPTLPATTILAGDGRASTYFEAAPPIRVNAVDLGRGGLDLGLFGYMATLVNDPSSIFKIEAGA